MYGRDEAAYQLRGTTLLDVLCTPTRLRRINAYLCNGRARWSLFCGQGYPQAPCCAFSADCSGRSYDLFPDAAFHPPAALCEASTGFVSLHRIYYLYYTRYFRFCQGLSGIYLSESSVGAALRCPPDYRQTTGNEIKRQGTARAPFPTSCSR